MIVYISGPISGTDDYMKRFRRAEDRLRAMGHKPVNPAWIHQPFNGTDAGHDEYIESCKRIMAHCDAIYLMRNWQKSLGAIEELREAQSLGLWIATEEGAAKLDAPSSKP